MKKHLVVFILANECYGVSIADVVEIIKVSPITFVPRAPAFIEGVTNLRGKVLPVMDLRKRFGLLAGDFSRDTRIVVAEIGTNLVGMLVDAVSEVLQIPEDAIEPPSPIVTTVDSDFISGIAKVDDRLIILLDLKKVLSAEERTGLRALGQASRTASQPAETTGPSLDATLEEAFDEASGEGFDEAFDEGFNEASGEGTDEAFDEASGEGFDEAFDEAPGGGSDGGFTEKLDAGLTGEVEYESERELGHEHEMGDEGKSLEWAPAELDVLGEDEAQALEPSALETSTPEAIASETDVPEAEAPETGVLETDMPETDVSETGAPDAAKKEKRVRRKATPDLLPTEETKARDSK